MTCRILQLLFVLLVSGKTNAFQSMQSFTATKDFRSPSCQRELLSLQGEMSFTTLGSTSSRGRLQKSFVLYAASDDKDTSDDDDTILSRRLEELRAKEAQESADIMQALNQRLEEVQASEEQKSILVQSGGMDETENLAVKEPTILSLPVIVLDALLPRQTMEGRTEDPNFSNFLRDLGLGGCFVMTSLDPKQRKVRRHGVVVQVLAVDAISNDKNTKTEEEKESSTLSDVDRWLQMAPTAVDFQMVGLSRCRVVGPTEGMARRIGRWRRGYDPNGEESQLRWGEERFINLPADRIGSPLEEPHANQDVDSVASKAPYTEWSSVLVLVNLESLEATSETIRSKDFSQQLEECQEMVDEWYTLASNPETFENTNVTASTRVRRGHPGLWVDPAALLRRVSQQLGPRPKDPGAFCIWAGAMVNPLPPLGVSLEIRGRLLEAPSLEQRLQVLELGLKRSIDNLTGRRPLV